MLTKKKGVGSDHDFATVQASFHSPSRAKSGTRHFAATGFFHPYGMTGLIPGGMEMVPQFPALRDWFKSVRKKSGELRQRKKDRLGAILGVLAKG
jgi:hypothetical protein